MSETTETENAAAPAEPRAKKKLGVDDLLRTAFSSRAGLLAQYPVDRAAVAQADQEIQSLATQYKCVEKFDPDKEPVLAYLVKQANRAKPGAIQLIFQPRVHLSLYQRDAGETPMPDQHVVYSGLRFDVPRGRRVTVPQLVADLIEQGGIR